MSDNGRTKRKVTINMIAIFLLFSMLVVTTYALISSIVSVEENEFSGANVKIGLNDGEVVFDSSDIIVEPGMAIKRNFTVENKSTVDVFYRLYLENIFGSLKDVLLFEIYEGDEKLFSSSVADFQKSNPCIGGKPLRTGETRVLTAVVKMAESSSSQYQGSGISFDLTAEAVQSRNNPESLFD